MNRIKSQEISWLIRMDSIQDMALARSLARIYNLRRSYKPGGINYIKFNRGTGYVYCALSLLLGITGYVVYIIGQLLLSDVLIAMTICLALAGVSCLSMAAIGIKRMTNAVNLFIECPSRIHFNRTDYEIDENEFRKRVWEAAVSKAMPLRRLETDGQSSSDGAEWLRAELRELVKDAEHLLNDKLWWDYKKIYDEANRRLAEESDRTEDKVAPEHPVEDASTEEASDASKQ